MNEFAKETFNKKCVELNEMKLWKRITKNDNELDKNFEKYLLVSIESDSENLSKLNPSELKTLKSNDQSATELDACIDDRAILIKLNEFTSKIAEQTGILSSTSEQLMKSIVLLDSCLLEIENVSWKKEIIEVEAQRLSQKLHELEIFSSSLNNVIYLLTIPLETKQLLTSPINENEISYFINSIDTFFEQFKELLEFQREIKTSLFDSVKEEFELIFCKVAESILCFLCKVIDKLSLEDFIEHELIHERIENYSELFVKLITIEQPEYYFKFYQYYTKRILTYFVRKINTINAKFLPSDSSFDIMLFNPNAGIKRLKRLETDNPYLLENKFSALILKYLDNAMLKEDLFINSFFRDAHFRINSDSYFKDARFSINSDALKNILIDFLCTNEKEPLGILICISSIDKITFEPLKLYILNEILPHWLQKYNELIELNIKKIHISNFYLENYLKQPQKIPSHVVNVCQFIVQLHQLLKTSTENHVNRNAINHEIYSSENYFPAEMMKNETACQSINAGLGIKQSLLAVGILKHNAENSLVALQKASIEITDKCHQLFFIYLSSLEAKLKNSSPEGIILLINCIDYMSHNIQTQPIADILHSKLRHFIKQFSLAKSNYSNGDLFRLFTNPDIVQQLS